MILRMMLNILSVMLCLTVFAAVSFAQDTPPESPGETHAVIETTILPETSDMPEGAVSEEGAETAASASVPEDGSSSEAAGIDAAASPTEDAKEDAKLPLELSAEEEASIDPVIAAEVKSFYLPLNILKMPSLFFTKWEHDLLIDARRGANVRPVVPGDAGSELLLPPDGGVTVENSPREINLNGIAYVSPTSWTIWLNSIRITPTALLPEIMDLTVYKDRIEIEWLDRQTNQIYPIRLRPHEKFNIDTRMFLPADSQ